MKKRALPVMLAISLCPPLFGQAAASSSDEASGALESGSPQLYGSIVGAIYTSATGTFQVKIPVLPQLGGTVVDSPNSVTFVDDYSVNISISAFPLSRELKWEFDTRGNKDFLAYFFANLVMPDLANQFAGAKMEDNGLYLPKFQDGSMLIFTLLPGGSHFEGQVSLFGRHAPLVSKRGNLCFVKNGYIFIVGMELAEHVLERSIDHPTPEQENALLRDRLMAVVRTMQFLKPPEAKD